MKKFLITLCCAAVVIGASAQDGKLAVNAGFLFPSTLNAIIGYERPLSYGNAVELYGEAGTHWQEKDFWKGYYWDGGIVYKQRLVRYKNGMLRFRFGHSSVRCKNGSSSGWREDLNTAMCSKTAGSSP